MNQESPPRDANTEATSSGSPPPVSLLQIAYVSSTAGLLTREALDELLKKSRVRNQERGITGIMLYRDGNVMHIIEGEKSIARQLFTTIEHDPRHCGVIRLYEKEITERDFPTWSMGYHELTEGDSSHLEGYSDVLGRGADLAAIRPSQARRLIEFFKRQGSNR